MDAPVLRVEGWRGVSHSFAMVNQQQLLAWLVRGGVALQHQDLPFFRPHWNRGAHDPGFAPAQQARLASLAAPDARPPDALYRIAFPADVSPARHEGLAQHTFMVCEYGLPPSYLAPGLASPAALLRDIDRIVTPSHWARGHLLRAGFPERQVVVVPHGVDVDTFRPCEDGEREALRRAFGFGPGHFVFANAGIPTWNKGVDTLLVAFARVHQRHPGARLVLKNHRTLYGVSADETFKTVAHTHPGLLTSAVMDAIFLVENNLSQADLQAVYACADCYVSPYRAEGFNLPVLEAMACGTPVIVTAGGPTDDFCPEGLATRVPSVARPTDPRLLDGGTWLDIDADALHQAMDDAATRGPARLHGPAWQGHRHGLRWAAVAEQLLALMLPGRPRQAAASPASAEPAEPLPA